MAGSHSFFVASSLVGVLAVLAYVGIGRESQFVFDPAVLKEVAVDAIREGAGNSTRVVHACIRRLTQRYPEHVRHPPDGKFEWIFNNAGGAMGAMVVLHASLSEYVIIFGTAVGTEGHTGRFLADDYFTILYGEQWAFSPGEMRKEVYRPGDQHHLVFGHAKQYRMPDECWALEYARGNIVSMLPFGLWDTFFSTLDFHTLWLTSRISATHMISELLRGKV